MRGISIGGNTTLRSGRIITIPENGHAGSNEMIRTVRNMKVISPLRRRRNELWRRSSPINWAWHSRSAGHDSGSIHKRVQFPRPLLGRNSRQVPQTNRGLSKAKNIDSSALRASEASRDVCFAHRTSRNADQMLPVELAGRFSVFEPCPFACCLGTEIEWKAPSTGDP